MTSRADSETVKTFNPNPWVLRRLFAESDAELSSESFLLGIGGLSALAFVLCIGELMAQNLIGPLSSAGPMWAIVLLMLFKSSVNASVSVSIVVTLLVDRDLIWRIAVAGLNCIPTVLFVATLEVVAARRFAFFHANGQSTNMLEVFIMSAIIGVVLVAILAKAFLSQKLNIRLLAVLACCFPGLLLIGLPIELYRAFPDDFDYHFRRIVYTSLHFGGILIGSALGAIPWSMANQRMFVPAQCQASETSGYSIYFLMELTFCVAVFSAVLASLSRSLPNVSTNVFYSTRFGLALGVLTLLCIYGFYAENAISRKRRLLLAFTLVFLAAASDMLFRNYAPATSTGTILLLTVRAGLCGALPYAGVVFLGVWWQRGCGWQLLRVSRTTSPTRDTADELQ